MREVNFSIPNVNKASVYITATLYDRRALDCTSTLPLINSLNHLAYLTTSSARIRDILTVDGGVERLVCILKEGRSKDEMHMWKWNLAFQCIVNIGVRGSEDVRTRVVEADMVPVIATILHDYVLVIDRERSKVDSEEAKKKQHKVKAGPQSARFPPRDFAAESASRTSFFDHQNSEHRQARRQAPPPSLEITQSFAQRLNNSEDTPTEASPAGPSVLTSPPERTTFARPILQQNRSHDGRSPFSRSIPAGPATAVPSTDTADVFALRPVRDVDRLPSMLPTLHSGLQSNPESPTTPHAPVNQRNILAPIERRMRRPSIRHQLSMSGDSDDAIMEDANPVNETTQPDQDPLLGNGRSTPQVVGIVDRDADILEEPEHLTINIPENIQQGPDNVDIAQQTPTATNVLDGIVPVNDEETGNSPAVNGQPQTASPAPPLSFASSMLLRNTFPNGTTIPLMPRDDDVLMGLQLLAYISKYCDLRHYFQATHLVPRLRIDREVEKIFGPVPGRDPLPEPEEDEDEEYLQKEDYNIFPLVEKFTQPHYSKDMQYWACVVMRNLCRKDDAKGGIRQCANYTCGKWEEFPRQFAKCRRCRRTKYCSKDCQRISWSMHRHWCQTP